MTRSSPLVARKRFRGAWGRRKTVKWGSEPTGAWIRLNKTGLFRKVGVKGGPSGDPCLGLAPDARLCPRAKSGRHLAETPLTGKLDAGNPPVQFGGRGEVNPSSLPLSPDYRQPADATLANAPSFYVLLLLARFWQNGLPMTGVRKAVLTGRGFTQPMRFPRHVIQSVAL